MNSKRETASVVAACLRRHELDRAPGVVAVSGGPDSVALAHLLIELRLPRLILAHVNHQLRGAESDADEAFVQQLAESVRMPCRTTRVDVAALATKKRDNVEDVARRERYAWLTQIAVEQKAAWIATGHSADDQAETVLFRLLRGSGVVGLSGMVECRPLREGVSLVRPLLSIRRRTLHEYLNERKIPYRLDSSNRDPRFTRNRLRLELLPLLEANYNPAMVDVLCRLAEQTKEVSVEILTRADLLRARAELPRAGEVLVFSLESMQETSANLLREMFRLVWTREDWPMGDMDFDHWQRLAELVQGAGSACDLPGGVRAQRAGKVLQLCSSTFAR